MAIIAVVAWQIGIVWQRRTAMQSGPALLLAVPIPNGGPLAEREKVNPLRALFGDRPVRYIYLDPGQQTHAQIERLEQLFPEAKLVAREPAPVRPMTGDGTPGAFGD